MTFRLREILLDRNIPFNIFAARIDMSPSSLAVTDKSLPTLANVQIYADALGMPAWELIYDCGVEAQTPYTRPADSLPLDDVVVNRVMEFLQEKNMSMRRLAINMDVTAAALTQAFKRKKMGLKLVEKMATGLGVEPWQLLATPEEVRGEVLRRKAALGIEVKPEPSPAAIDVEPGAAEDTSNNATDVMLTALRAMMGEAESKTITIGEFKITIERGAAMDENETEEPGDELSLVEDR